jgi:uncharacterized protein YcnI
MKQVILAILLGTTLQAHVVVRPAQSTTGLDQKYTMRVPNEKQVPTTSIQLAFPEAIVVSAIDEQPGWKLTVDKNAQGKIVRATWTGALAPGQAAEFTFTAHNPKSQTVVEWNAIQTFQDGSKSEWTGPQGSKTPASSTTISTNADKTNVVR